MELNVRNCSFSGGRQNPGGRNKKRTLKERRRAFSQRGRNDDRGGSNADERRATPRFPVGPATTLRWRSGMARERPNSARHWSMSEDVDQTRPDLYQMWAALGGGMTISLER